jgi:Abhydrolase family/Concanavalin A-like lectin/glucanases superfamily
MRYAAAVLFVSVATAELTPRGAVLYFDFAKSAADLVSGRNLSLHGCRLSDLKHDPMQREHGPALECTSAAQYAEVALPRALDGVLAVSVGGWFYTRRHGEQVLLTRGLPEIAPLGERRFPPNGRWVNFTLGTDEHGFLMGAINGNSTMPFVHVTVNELPINTWTQFVVVKDAEGYQKFYQNGTLVHTDRYSCWGGKVWPFHDLDVGEPVRMSVPQGGMIGEAWIYPRELEEAEILSDYHTKKRHYTPALPAKPVLLRAMDERPSATLWEQLSPATWPAIRRRILTGVAQIFGTPPSERASLDPKVESEEDCGIYVRRKVSIQVQPGDRMPAYLLIPKKRPGKTPVIICFYGTTGGAGKLTTVGLSGPKPGSPPVRNRDFAVTMAEAGFIAFAADYLRDGERIKPGKTPYDATEFYQQFPNWSIHGKDAWDTSRAIDYLETLDFVDTTRIGMVGHSYGGHSTIFTSAIEPRIKVAVANGPVSDFIHHGMHWGVARGSQSLPAMKPYVLDHTLKPPLTFYEVTALIAPRPLLVGEAVGERRPMEEENAAAVSQVYRTLGYGDRVRYHWYAGDHDFPPEAQQAAVEWFRKWFQDLK